MEDVIRWSASLATIAAAFTVSLNAGARITGYGFVIFVVSSILWVAGAGIAEEWPLLLQSIILFVINCLGVYRYLFVKSKHAAN